MVETHRPSAPQFFPLLVRGYVLGTLMGAIALHIAISIIAPGDAGTINALASVPILFVIIIAVGLLGLFAFPIAAAISWPFRAKVISSPLLTGILSGVAGVVFGAVLTATHFQIGPDDFWSGPLVGFIFGLVWFQVVRSSSKRNIA